MAKIIPDLDIRYEAQTDRHYKYVGGKVVYGMVSMSGQFIPVEEWNKMMLKEVVAGTGEVMTEEEFQKSERIHLRDKFAMHAMSTLVATLGVEPKAVAITAYKIADAMMVARDLS